MKRLFPLTLLAAAALPGPAFASTIFSTDFAGGTTSGWFAYYTGAAPTLTVSSDATLGGGNSLLMNSSTGSFKGAAVNFTSQALSVGDTLTLTMDFRLAETPSNNSAGIRLGLANQSTLGSAATGTGYYIGLGTGTSFGSTFNSDTGTDSFTSGTVTSLTTTTPASFALADQLKHSFTFNITRTISGYDLSFSSDGGSAYTASDSGTGIVNAFNTIAIVQGGVTTDFRLDNVVLTYTPVPEPATYGLIGASLLASCAYVRRRRRAV